MAKLHLCAEVMTSRKWWMQSLIHPSTLTLEKTHVPAAVAKTHWGCGWKCLYTFVLGRGRKLAGEETQMLSCELIAKGTRLQTKTTSLVSSCTRCVVVFVCQWLKWANLEVQRDHREPRLEFAHYERNKESLFKGTSTVVSGCPIIVTSFPKSHPLVLSECFENNTVIFSYLETLMGFHVENYHLSHVFFLCGGKFLVGILGIHVPSLHSGFLRGDLEDVKPPHHTVQQTYRRG